MSRGKSLAAAAVMLSLLGCASARPGAAPAAYDADLLVEHATVLTVDEDFRVIEDGAVAVKDGEIIRVDSSSSMASLRVRERVDARGDILMPGLVNPHNHAAMTLLRGGADDMELHEWLTSFIFPAEGNNVAADYVLVGTRLACAEMIAGGTTTFGDMYYFEDQVARAVDESGMRGVLGETVIGFPSPDSPTPEDALDYVRTFAAKWKGHARVTPAIAPHAAYTVAPELLTRCWDLAEELDIPFLIHVAETQKEESDVQEQYGASPVQHLASLGVLSERTVAAHCVVLSSEDIATLARTGAGCVHCPESNMKLASGAAPVSSLLVRGVPVGIGTDGPASNNDLDMFEAMDFASKLGKHASGDPTALPARAVVEMATRHGAAVLGLEDQIGSLEVGKRADMILIDTSSAHMIPLYSAASHVVSVADASDVRMTWVDGRLLYDGERVLTLDLDSIRTDALKYQRQILDSLPE